MIFENSFQPKPLYDSTILFYDKIFSISTTARAFQNHWLLTKTVEPTQPMMRERAAQDQPSALQAGNLGQQRKITAHVKSLMKVYKTSIVHKDVHFIFSTFTKFIQWWTWLYKNNPHREHSQ